MFNILAIVALALAQKNGMGYVGVDTKNLVLNSTTAGTVLANGVDILGKFKDMENVINQQATQIKDLQNLVDTIVQRLLTPTSSPTIPPPTSSPTMYPTSPCGNIDNNNNSLPDKCETEVTFKCTNASVMWKIPSNASKIYFELKGAGGWEDSYNAGEGGITSGVMNVTSDMKNKPLYLYVGGQGRVAPPNYVTGVGGGWNGGGWGRSNTGSNAVGGGGGATDVRLIQGDLYSRILVAGGGGGSTDNSYAHGGNGGGLIGANAEVYSTYHNGKGGTQTSGGDSGGAFGLGGNGSTGTPWNGGGGGGWYGGGASLAHSGGGGGSSYANSTYIYNAVMKQGGNKGDGYLRIVYA